MSNLTNETRLSLMPGEIVEVLSAEEIAATLDENGCLDRLPFMPEMLEFCGTRHRVFRRADKTCDTVNRTGGRRMFDTVHLENTRCDGSGHGGCDASCSLFWKEDWLKRVGSIDGDRADGASPAYEDFSLRLQAQATQAANPELYRCQATALPEYTTLLHWWDARQYLRDLRTGNTSFGGFLRVMSLAAFRALLRLGIGHSTLIYCYDAIQKIRGGKPYPIVGGHLSKTPVEEQNFQPGNYVRIKALEEINKTLDGQAKNRGLRFDPEMARFCGGSYRVSKRVEKIIEESTGRMLHFKTPSVLLEDVYCHSEVSSCRLFCPRSIVSYWREIWLERVADPLEDQSAN